MAGPTYNQVALPQLGGATEAQALADAKVTQGLTGLSASFTGLAGRLETRKQAKIDRDNAKGKEILETALLNAKDENEFNSIVQEFAAAANTDGFVLPGQAAAIQASRTARLKDEESRQTGRGLGADADLTAANARLKIGEADTADLETAADKAYAPEMAAALALGYTNPEASAAAIADINAKRAANFAGSDLVSPYNDVDGVANQGINTRSARDTELTDNVTNATERAASVGSRGVTAAVQARQKFGAISGLEGDRQAVGDAATLRSANEFVSGLKTKGISDEDNIQRIRNSEFSEAVKIGMIEAYKSGVPLNDANPLQDKAVVFDPNGREISATTNVARTLSNMLLDTNLPTNQADQLPVSRMADGIVGMVRTQIDADPDMSIYARAQERAADPENAKFVGDIGMYAEATFPSLDWEQNQLQLVKTVKEEYGLSNDEMIVIVGESIKTQGVFGNSPEISDTQLRNRAKAYKEGKPAVTRRYNALRTDETNAARLQSQVTEARINQQRALEGKNEALYRQYGDEVRVLAQQMAAIESELDRRGSKTTGIGKK